MTRISQWLDGHRVESPPLADQLRTRPGSWAVVGWVQRQVEELGQIRDLRDELGVGFEVDEDERQLLARYVGKPVDPAVASPYGRDGVCCGSGRCLMVARCPAEPGAELRKRGINTGAEAS
jgi:hypothetical protein